MTALREQVNQAVTAAEAKSYVIDVHGVLHFSLGWLAADVKGILGQESCSLAKDITKAYLATNDLYQPYTNFPPVLIREAVLASVGALKALNESVRHDSVATVVDQAALDEQYKRYKDGTLVNYLP